MHTVPVACCCSKFETGQNFSNVQIPTMLGVVLLGVFGQQCCVLFHLPTMLGVVGQQFCVRLHRALVTDILIIFSNINFSLLIIHMNICAIFMYPALYAARKISLNFLFGVHDLVWFPIVYFYDLTCLPLCFVSIKIA